MAKTCELEIWVKVDADGDYRVGIDAEAAAEAFETDIGESADTPTRLVKVVLTIPLPAVATLTGTVPAEGEAVLAVA
jgi:hypothetical protein